MAETPEDDLLEWLEREEERLGLSTLEESLGDIDIARQMFYDELGYDLTEAQFGGLKDALNIRYEELPSISISYSRIEHSWGFQSTWRDVITGRFISSEDVYVALKFNR